MDHQLVKLRAGADHMLPDYYVDRLYAAFLGMNIGIRLGAPIEPQVWDFHRIEQVFGDIRDYTKKYQTFAADDDANGPVFFIRALYDDAVNRELTAEDVGKAWLNYTREGVGMFWWGGINVSTEHTAYVNLQNGISAPKSGSIEMNGLEIAEQIGGQIFIDSWGLLFPGNVEKAAEYAEKAASVSHDGNGVYGARFMAACIAKAFDTTDINEVIAAGLSVIPTESTYAKVVHAVQDFHSKQPDDFRACRIYLEEEWGYDKYGGICHIIPNSGVCVLAMLYGAGNYARTIEIACMCGWDTDCNAGNVGTILGVMAGIEAIPHHYREPINDFIVASSVSGYLNIVDFSTFSKELALLGYRLAGQKPPQRLVDTTKFGEVFYNFDLPGSTHAIRTSNPFKTPVVRHSDNVTYESRGSLEIVFDRIARSDHSKIFYKPFYRREEFNDEKYKPTFSPQAYSGQTVKLIVYVDQWEGEPITLTPYVRNTYTKEDVRLAPVQPVNGQWNLIEFEIPNTSGAVIDEIGWVLESESDLVHRAIGSLYIGLMHIYGNASYDIDFAKQYVEFTSITPFSQHKGNWKLQEGQLNYNTETVCSTFSGNYYSRNYEVSTELTPLSGSQHGIIVRAEGIMRHYWLGFDGENKVSLVKQDFGKTTLATAPFEWSLQKTYQMRVVVEDKQITLFMNDEQVLTVTDDRYAFGMYGFGSLSAGEANIGTVHVIVNE